MGRAEGRVAANLGLIAAALALLTAAPATAQTPTPTFVGPTSTATPTSTPTNTPTATNTPTPSNTPTPTNTPTPSNTPTGPTPTATVALTPVGPTTTATATPPVAQTATPTPTPTPTPVPAGDDAYQCYGAKVTPKTPKLARRDAALGDALGNVTAKVRKVAALCNPAGVAGGTLADPTAHLLCYGVKEPKRAAKTLPDFAVTDAFGTLTLDVQKALQLCLPAEKNGVASGLGNDPVHCWKARVARGTAKFTARSVALTDQFGGTTAEVRKPAALCLATSVDGTPAPDPAGALVCYALGAPKTAARPVTTRDAFGSLAVTARRPTLLCLPATAATVP